LAGSSVVGRSSREFPVPDLDPDWLDVAFAPLNLSRLEPPVVSVSAVFSCILLELVRPIVPAPPCAYVPFRCIHLGDVGIEMVRDLVAPNCGTAGAIAGTTTGEEPEIGPRPPVACSEKSKRC